MASLSGLNSLYADRLKLRKPGLWAPRQDVFAEFLRNPEATSTYNAEGDLWTPNDNAHVPNVSDCVAFVLAHVGSAQIDYARLEGDLEAWLGQPAQLQMFRGPQGIQGLPQDHLGLLQRYLARLGSKGLLDLLARSTQPA